MTFESTADLLSYLLEDHALSPDELDEVIATLKEGQLLDYKDGKLTQKGAAKAKETIREYVSGYANAEGGVLIVGVSETAPRAVSPCQRFGVEPLDTWAHKVIADMVGYLSPLPRFQVVPHPQGEVLVAAVARAPQLVPCVESRQTKYFIRIHDSTLEVPAFLIADLVLGRRQHPALALKSGGARWKLEIDGTRMEIAVSRLRLDFQLENQSLIPAPEVDIGVVGWGLTKGNARLNDHLQTYVDGGQPPDARLGSLQWQIVHLTNRGPHRPIHDVLPFDARVVADLHGPTLPRDGFQTVRCGLYVLARGSVPAWYQLDVPTSGRVDAGIETIEPQDITLRRIVGVRATIGCVPR